MRTRALVLVAAAALALAGCGAHHLVLRVDVLSYLDPSTTSAAFGPVPAAPGGLTTGEVAIVEREVNLVDGMSSVAEVQSVTLTLDAVVHDSTGSGTDTLRVYLAGDGVDPLTTTPVLQTAVTLSAGQSDSVHVVVPCDARVGDLFVQKRLRLGVTMSARGPDAGDPLTGRVELRTLEAVIVAGRKAL